MSSGENSTTTTTATAVTKMFFCHQCDRTVTISVSSTSDPLCPRCNGGFLEEYEGSSPNQTLNLDSGGFTTDPLSVLLPLLLGSSASAPTSSTVINPSFYRASTQPRATQQHGNAFDPMLFLQNHLAHLRSSGTQVQFVVENHPSDLANNRIPGNFGDYFFGPGLEQLIQQLAENDPNRYGTPPASKSSVDSLPTVKVTKDMLKSEMNQCAVCMDEFEDGGDVKQMPCKHVFHQDCLLPWLQLHNSCPVCRYELPTDDTDYENRAQGVQGGQSSGGVQGSVEEQQTTPRRFSIQLPWPFRRQDGSGSGSGEQGGGANLETRQEDLD
ncbi:unnamed protein product [Cochlearia groenlandica]